MIAHVEPFAEGACGSHTRRGWIRNSSGDSLPNRHKRSLRLVMPACKPSTPPSWRTRPNCTTWSCVRCAPAIRGPCSGFRLFGTNRDLTARALVMDPRGVLREKIRLHRLQSVKKLSKGVDSFFDHISAVGRQSIARSSAGNSTVRQKRTSPGECPIEKGAIKTETAFSGGEI
jgi:hypothetical protein